MQSLLDGPTCATRADNQATAAREIKPYKWVHLDEERCNKPSYFDTVGWLGVSFSKKLSAISIFISSPSIQSRSSAFGPAFSFFSSCSFRAHKFSMAVMVEDLS